MTHLTEQSGPDGSSTGEGDRPARGSHRSPAIWWTFAAGLVLAAAAIVAVVQNSRPVALHYLVWHANVSLIAIVLATVFVAIVLDELGGLAATAPLQGRPPRRAHATASGPATVGGGLGGSRAIHDPRPGECALCAPGWARDLS
jgi:uncharacterized integral membrane protein